MKPSMFAVFLFAVCLTQEASSAKLRPAVAKAEKAAENAEATFKGVWKQVTNFFGSGSEDKKLAAAPAAAAWPAGAPAKVAGAPAAAAPSAAAAKKPAAEKPAEKKPTEKKAAEEAAAKKVDIAKAAAAKKTKEYLAAKKAAEEKAAAAKKAAEAATKKAADQKAAAAKKVAEEAAAAKKAVEDKAAAKKAKLAKSKAITDMKEKYGAPSQGYDEHSSATVQHEDAKTMTADWGQEWNQQDEDETTTFKRICKKEPTKWCKENGYAPQNTEPKQFAGSV